MKFCFFVFFIIFSSLFFANCFAQKSSRIIEPNKKLNRFIIENITTENGLPTNSLLNLCRTTDGYLWLSSYSGLMRFNGYEFTVFDKSNTSVFKTDVINELAEDKNGVLWITTEGSGLVSYKNGVFKSHGLDENIKQLNRVLFIDKQNRIWSKSIERGLSFFENNLFHFFPDSNSFVNIGVSAIEENNKNVIWIGTNGKGLYKYKNGKFTNYSIEDGLSSNIVFFLHFDDKNNILWIGTDNGVNYFTGKSFQSIPETSNYSIQNIVQDDNNLWIGTTKGLFYSNIYTKKTEYLSDKNGLFNHFINDLSLDTEGNLWSANYKGGLTKIKKSKFTNFTKSSGLSGKVVNAICEYNYGIYLLAFDNGYINKIENGNISVFNTKTSLIGKRIRHLLKDSQDNIWISTYSGLLKIMPNGDEIFYNNKNGFPETQIRLVYEDVNTDIWVGTRNNGLIKINKDGTFKIFNKTAGLGANLIMSIGEDEHDNLLVGTSGGGLNIISGKKSIKKISEKEGFISNIIFNTYTDTSGIIWVATNKGLSCIYNEKFVNFTEKEGLINESPYDILEDDYGNFWLPCNKGIMKIKKNTLIDFANKLTKTIDCKLYDVNNGVKKSECNPTTQSLKAYNGTLWFPTVYGLAVVEPNNISENNFVPPVYIEKLIVDNVSVNFKNKIIIESDKQRLTFNYTALSFYEPEKNLFKYRLVGFEKDWIDAGSDRSVSYTNLPYGNYTFKVIACNNDGLWNKTGAELSFYIKPYFYETSKFYFASGLIFTILIFLIYRARLSKLERRQVELEVLIDERTEEIRFKNVELQHQKEEVQIQAEYLADANKAITKQKDKIQESHQEIRDSINYASRIQKALLPSKKLFNEIFPAHFILYKPKDIVSGDFYYFKKVNEYLIIAVADCTGHGVPGAFVSMLGIAFLNEIIGKKELKTAAEVLEDLRTQVKISLKQTDNDHDAKDGMDIALCVINTKTDILQFAGAFNPLYLIRNNKLIITKATRNPIGIYVNEEPFENNKIQLQKHDKIYMFSDGYADQFGGKRGKKFMSKKFKELLLKISEKPFPEQKEILNTTIENWKKNEDQTDDIIVIGIKL